MGGSVIFFVYEEAGEEMLKLRVMRKYYPLLCLYSSVTER